MRQDGCTCGSWESADYSHRPGCPVRPMLTVREIEERREMTAAYLSDDSVATFIYEHREHDTFTGFAVHGPYIGCNNCCALTERWRVTHEADEVPLSRGGSK